MKFRKKPIIIEAEQWFPGKKIEGVCTKLKNLDLDMEVEPYIDTIEGRMKVSEGDWIIIGVEGEIYCCKDSIFKKSYERIEDK